MNPRELQDAYIARLEDYWDIEGFLGQLRQGHFDFGQAQEFVEFLQGLELAEDEAIRKRLVELLWFLPTFLAWQAERIDNLEPGSLVYENFCDRVIAVLQDRLGVP